jgi:polysaccharide biosynthesis/export protein
VRDGRIVPVDFQSLLRGGDLSQNVYLQPGDFVYVPSLRSAQVHVLGAVLQPRSERMTGAMTVVQAIALAGGTVPTACLPNVAILRGSLTHPQIAIVAVNDVLHGKAPDVRLEPGDIVFVPYKPDRVLVRYVNLILDTFVRTVGVNEGAYTIDSKAAPVTVGVNLAP